LGLTGSAHQGIGEGERDAVDVVYCAGDQQHRDRDPLEGFNSFGHDKTNHDISSSLIVPGRVTTAAGVAGCGGNALVSKKRYRMDHRDIMGHSESISQ
jgi:hypothetical protein